MSWIFYTIAAAILQSFRNLEQKALNKKLDVLTVTWSRFILPLPFAIATVLFTKSQINSTFLLYCIITGTFQVAGNIALLKTIKSRNFSVGVAFYKTETLQSMIIGLLLFSQAVSFIGFMAIMITTIGIFLISKLSFKSKEQFITSIKDPATIYGLLSGFCFSISAFNLKFACDILMPLGYSNFKASLIVLMWVICIQNIIFIIIKSYQKTIKEDLKSLFFSENKLAFIKTTLLSFVASTCWFTAFSLQKVVYVKAVGQIELVTAILISHFILKEKHSRREMLGIGLTSFGILILIFFH